MKVYRKLGLLLSSLYKSAESSRRNQIFTALAVVAMIGGSLLLFQTNLGQQYFLERSRQTGLNQAERLEQIHQQEALERQKKQNERTASDNTGSNDATSNSKKATSAPSTDQRIKYSTSPDPRSTAFSYTPPAPNPASFTTRITHSGQVAAGTLIEYNATKGDRTYYGGDLVLSRPSMTISRSNPSKGYLMRGVNDVTISAPDGAVIGMASLPWDEPSQYFAIAHDSSNTQTTGTSVEMFVAAFGTPPLGITTLHIISGPVAQSADGWRNDGFITINVVE